MDACEYIVMGGGGVKGLMYIGMIKAFDDHLPSRIGRTRSEYMQGIKGFAGTSVGAFASLMLLLNLNTDTIDAIVRPVVNSFRSLMPRPDISLMINSFGLDNGDAMRGVITNALHVAGLCSDATFHDLQRLLQKEYRCVATDLQTQEPVVFSAEKTPQVRIVDAVFMSMCVPFMWAPMKHDGHYMIDGSLTQNMPNVYPEEKTLFIDFEDTKVPYRVDTLNDFIMSVLQLTTDRNSDWYHHNSNKIIMRAPKKMGADFPMNLDVGTETIQARLRCGYASTLASLYPRFQITIEEAIEMVYAIALEQQHLAMAIGAEL